MWRKAWPSHPGGRPPHNPTQKDRRTVEILSGFGLPQLKIAHVLGVGSLNTLRKHYLQELERGAAMIEMQLVGNLFRLAQGNDAVALRAIIFSLCSRFGWSQYAPYPLGKKDRADLDAATAHEGTDWSDLIN